jgi:hypothetical protein
MSVESRIRSNLGDLCKGSAKEDKELKLRANGGSMGKSFGKWAKEEMAESAHKGKTARKKRLLGGSMGNIANTAMGAGKQLMASPEAKQLGAAAETAGKAAMGIGNRGLGMVKDAARSAINSPAGRDIISQGRGLANKVGLGSVADNIGGAVSRFFKKGGSSRHRNKCGR